MSERRILITAGATREPIDPVRFIGNRSSGKMGAALVAAALEAGHALTLIAGVISTAIPAVRRINVETAAEMHAAVLREFSDHDILIMAAAVADFRPVHVNRQKMSRSASLVIECEPTADIVAAACKAKRAEQRVVAFSLESDADLQRARSKMMLKAVDLMVFNALATMNSSTIHATILSPTVPDEPLPEMDKDAFARWLIARAAAL